MDIPNYIAARVRTPYPDHSCVIRGSTPVISFGDYGTASVATLSINPSKREFLGKDGWLPEGKRRLETLASLELEDLPSASDAQVEAIVDGCRTYFRRGGNAYNWFTPLNKLLEQGLDRSYAEGSAVHLDLVQWATDPVWRQVDDSVRQSLIEADRRFLLEQLMRENIELVVMNGRAVLDQVEAMGVVLTRVVPLVGARNKAEIVFGRFEGTAYFGWNQHIQNCAFTVAQASQVTELLGGWRYL